jgi:23S rRNA (adenine2503-C2)-methyltransferase
VAGIPSLYDLSREQLAEMLAMWREPGYRADQVYHWLYRSLVSDFASMRNLPLPLRARLEEHTAFGTLTPVIEKKSRNGLTRKVLFRLRDGQTIESVLMFYDERAEAEGKTTGSRSRRTACISTQVGCPIGCPFCATGQSGFVRDLTAGEIIEQVVHFARFLRSRGERLTNVVVMGMGEPLANYDATLEAIRRLIDPDGFGLGARHVTVSTAGLVPRIRRFAREGLQVGLAVSLHAADDKLRHELVPINHQYPLAPLLTACEDYTKLTKRRLTFEYALIHEVNDAPAQAQALVRLIEGMLCHVNLIPLNPTTGYGYGPSPRKRVQAFQAVLNDAGIASSLRGDRGLDIEAGCGQLWARPAQV